MNWNGSLHLDGGPWKATLQIANGKIEVTGDAAGENVIRGGADIIR